MIADPLRELGNRLGCLIAFRGRHQTKMSGGNLDAGIARQYSEYLEAHRLHSRDDLSGVSFGSCLVDDHAAQPDARVERVESVNDGGRRTRSVGDVQH